MNMSINILLVIEKSFLKHTVEVLPCVCGGVCVYVILSPAFFHSTL